jgi:hypothetical protein
VRQDGVDGHAALYLREKLRTPSAFSPSASVWQQDRVLQTPCWQPWFGEHQGELYHVARLLLLDAIITVIRFFPSNKWAQLIPWR